MSKIFEEALADAKKLKEVAEENAKKAILESVTPKIKEFIESQILEQDDIDISEDNEGADDDVKEIDAMNSLMEMLGINNVTKNIKNKRALSESYDQAMQNLSASDQIKMKNLIKKINKQKNNLQQRGIINSVNTIQENNQMRNREKFYEVDLSLLRESVQDAADEIASKEIEEELEKKEANEGFLDQMDEMDMYDSIYEADDDSEDDDDGKGLYEDFLYEQDDAPAGEAPVGDDDSEDDDSEDDDSEGLEAMDMGAPGGEAGGDAVELPLDLAQELQSILDAELAGGAGEAEAGGEEPGGLEDLDMGDLGGGEEAGEEGAGLYESVFDVDPRILREELANVKRMLSEGKMDHHFGGKGGGNIGHKHAYGGKGPKKHGYQKSFGGGSYGKDVFVTPPSTLKKLNEAIKQLRKLSRMNRAQNEKLNKYRGAVHTLREQLEDLNLFNAKLLYVNKLLQNKNLNESQKKSVIKALDEAKSLGETKALFKSLTESLSTPRSSLNESTRFGSSSRTTTSGSGTKNKVVGESDRWAKLAGLK